MYVVVLVLFEDGVCFDVLGEVEVDVVGVDVVV